MHIRRPNTFHRKNAKTKKHTQRRTKSKRVKNKKLLLVSPKTNRR